MIAGEILIQPDDKILVVGFFTTVGGVTRNLIARLNSDGTLDTGFDVNLEQDTSFSIFSEGKSLSLAPENKIILSGRSFLIDGITHLCIIRLNSDGTLDETFKPNDEFFSLISDINGNSSFVSSTIVQTNGQIFAAGKFRLEGESGTRYLSLIEEVIPNKGYIIKDKEMFFNDAIEISGGIVVDPGSSLIASTESGEKIIIQLYGIEETI
jgi:uncharacterized delta-60 repeat protein